MVSWLMMHVNMPLGSFVIVMLPFTFGVHVFSLVFELYNSEDDRMFGILSDFFTNELIPYPERNLLQAISEDFAVWVWEYNLEWLFGTVDIYEKRFV